jgi:predicted phage terminase large subunit-like protein
MNDFKPQPGAQTKFLSSSADIVIYGGAAGGGKTYGLLIENIRAVGRIKQKLAEYKTGKRFGDLGVPEFHSVIFRRTGEQLKKSGSIWDESKSFYGQTGVKPNQQEKIWRFDENIDIKFSGMQYVSNKDDWHGAQLDLICFDELSQFDEAQFWYLTSRLRSSSGYTKPYLRATSNPEPNWLLDLIEWWISTEGYPIPSRAGVIRWIVMNNDVLQWFDSKNEAEAYINTIGLQGKVNPLSFTFIPATIDDNPALLKRDPNYVSWLHSLGDMEKARLLYGNWRIKPTGKLFKIDDFKEFNVLPAVTKKIIVIDTAQETKSANDYTVMQTWGLYEKKIYLINQFRGKVQFNEQVSILVNMIITENPKFVAIERKSNGSALIQCIRRELSSMGSICAIRAIERTKDKYTRGRECQGYLESGYIYINPHADYYTPFISEISQFSPENKNKSGIHDDQVDCMMDAIDLLLKISDNNGNIAKSNSSSRILNLATKPKSFSGY